MRTHLLSPSRDKTCGSSADGSAFLQVARTKNSASNGCSTTKARSTSCRLLLPRDWQRDLRRRGRLTSRSPPWNPVCRPRASRGPLSYWKCSRRHRKWPAIRLLPPPPLPRRRSRSDLRFLSSSPAWSLWNCNLRSSAGCLKMKSTVCRLRLLRRRTGSPGAAELGAGNDGDVGWKRMVTFLNLTEMFCCRQQPQPRSGHGGAPP